MNINEITNLLKRGSFKNPAQIKSVIYSLKDLYMVPSLILTKGAYLYRARIIDNIEEICNPSNLSYIPSYYNKSYKRASTPDNTMFYGVSGDTHENMICGCLGEVCDCFRNHISSNKHYIVAIGIWETTRDFTLPQIINPDGQNKSDAFGNILEYQHYLRCLGEKASDIEDFQRLINHEFTKQVNREEEYWISAVFTEWVLSLQDSYDGIIYESVQSVDPKLINNHCVALKPQVADNDLLFKEGLTYEFDYTTGNDIVPRLTQKINFYLEK